VSSGSLKNETVSPRKPVYGLFPLQSLIDNITFEVFAVCAKVVNDKKVRKNTKDAFISLVVKVLSAQII
jgi:hypothetical protein